MSYKVNVHIYSKLIYLIMFEGSAQNLFNYEENTQEFDRK